MHEEWRPVEGFDGYEVSDQGRVRSSRTTRRGHVLRAGQQSSGYLTVVLFRDGAPRRSSMLVHRLVLAAFRGVCPPGHEARHLNGDRHYNRLSNLEWGTKAENAQDKSRHGTMAAGERNGRSVLTRAQVDLLRELGDRLPVPSAAILTGVSERTIRAARSGANWS